MTRKRAITDNEILHWLRSGLMIIRRVNIDPELWFRGRKLKPLLTVQRGRYRIAENCPRYSWRIRHDGRQRRIVRAKLVAMADSLELIPPYHHVHHVDEDRLNDCLWNLAIVDYDTHGSIHHDLPEY